MARELKIWNGRSPNSKGRVYVAGYTKKQVMEMLETAFRTGRASGWNKELDVYWSKGCWGNAMNGITPEVGVWVKDDGFSSKSPMMRLVDADGKLLKKPQVCKAGVVKEAEKEMTASEFNLLPTYQKWQLWKKFKSRVWACKHCGAVMEDGPRSSDPFFGHSIHCGVCEAELTRRTNGGQNEPFGWLIVEEKPEEEKPVSERKMQTDDDVVFGSNEWVYCAQHLRPHKTGWCTVGIMDKVALGVDNEKDAYAKCNRLGLKIFKG